MVPVYFCFKKEWNKNLIYKYIL